MFEFHFIIMPLAEAVSKSGALLVVPSVHIKSQPGLYGGSVLEDSYFDGFGASVASYSYDPHLRVTCTAGSR